eukprot:365344-Chlamydomonas_euryale.AAC.13
MTEVQAAAPAATCGALRGAHSTDPIHDMQCEKAYQRQFGVSGCFKSKEKKQPGHSGHRYYKSVGLGFKTPREAQFGENVR